MKYLQVENKVNDEVTFNFQIAVEAIKMLEFPELTELFDAAPNREFNRVDGMNIGVFNDSFIAMGNAELFVNKDWWKKIKKNLEVEIDEATDTWDINYVA